MSRIPATKRTRLYVVVPLILGFVILFTVNWIAKDQLFLHANYNILKLSQNSAISDLQVFPKNRIKMFLNPADDIITPNIIRGGIWEGKETYWFLKNIKEGNVVLDIGANVGYYTLIAARLVGKKGRVYAFEPEPVAFEILEKNVNLNGYRNVVLEQKAASNKKGSIKLFLAATNKGDHRIYQTEKQRPFVEIDAVSLDEYLEKLEDRIDFVKIDTQGAEVLILKGMKKIIESNDNIRMAIEFWPYGFSGLDFTGKECLDILSSHDFLLFDIMRSEKPGDMRPAKAQELLNTYTVENRLFTNLFVVKGRAEFVRLEQLVAKKALETAAKLQEGQGNREQLLSEYKRAEKALQSYIENILSVEK